MGLYYNSCVNALLKIHIDDLRHIVGFTETYIEGGSNPKKRSDQ